MKRNDYYYRVGSVSSEYPSRKEIFIQLAGWWSWREVCSMRRQGDYRIIEKRLAPNAPADGEKAALPADGER